MVVVQEVLAFRQIVVALMLSVLVGIAATAQTTNAWAVESWSTPIDLSATGYDASRPQIVAAPNNTLTAIWYRFDGSNYIIQTRSSTDGGATWSTVVDLSATGQHADQPQIVAARNNTLTAIWARYSGSNYMIQTKSSTDGGATWSTVVDLSATGQNANRPQIVAARNNTLTAIWYRNDGSNYILQTRSSTDGGATWSTVVDLSATGQDADQQQIVAAPNNTLSAIWKRSNGSNTIIQTRSSTDGGATWSTVVDVSATGQSAYEPQIVAAPNNTLTAIWYRWNGSNDIIQSSSLAPSSNSSSSSSSSVDDAVPGIFLTVPNGPGEAVQQAEVRYGSFAIHGNSPFLLSLREGSSTTTQRVLASGRTSNWGHLDQTTALPLLPAGKYTIVFSAYDVAGNSLILGNAITVNTAGKITTVTPEHLQPSIR